MARPVKFSQTLPEKSIKKGSTIHAVRDGNYGPTSSTGWYAGLRHSQYTIVEAYNGTSPNYYLPSNDEELILFCNTTASPTPPTLIITITEALVFLSNSNYTVLHGNTPPDNFPEGLPIDGLSMYVDSQISASVSIPNKWLDVSGNGLVFDSFGTALNLENVGGYEAWRCNGLVGHANSGEFRSIDKHGVVNMGGDCTIVMWLYCEGGRPQRGVIFEKIGVGGASFQGEIAITWEKNQRLQYFSRKTPGYDAAFGGHFTEGSWNMLSIKLSTGLTSEARRGFHSKNGNNYQESYTSRSNIALIPASKIRLGSGYAGPSRANNAMGAFLTYNKMLSNEEINQVWEATRERYGM